MYYLLQFVHHDTFILGGQKAFLFGGSATEREHAFIPIILHEILFINFYDVAGEGIHVTFDWNYLNENVQISKFIDPIFDESQLQISSLSLLNQFAYRVPQLFFDNHNLKLREKSE